jgi:hypothetical protein
MRKSAELESKTGCLAKAWDNEMIFVLLARDPAAPAMIRAWVAERIRLGLNTDADFQIHEALNCAAIMERQREPLRDAIAMVGRFEKSEKGAR